MVSLTALSIDAILPALPDIARDLAVTDGNDRQLVVMALILGLGAGQLVYGPLSDSIGRRPAILSGFALFLAGCLLSLFATSFQWMLAGRVLQGMGAAGPRIVTVALVRDQYEGRAMARVMSIVMAVFIMVPALAPALGQGILMLAHWRAVFGCMFAFAVVACLWFALRQPETLDPRNRSPFALRQVLRAAREVCAIRATLGYTLAAGFAFAALLGYLGSAQQVFQEVYGAGARFPLYFGVLALAIGGASLTNARLVMRMGMRRLCRAAAASLAALAGAFWLAAFAQGGVPPLWAFMACFMAAFFCIGVLFGNLNALAMEPLGRQAGVGAAVVGTLSTLVSVLIGGLIGLAYDGTVLPLVGGFAVLALAALAAMRWADGGGR